MGTVQALKGKVAVVAGATRGAGRGIACMLGEAGATVYCTGRNSRQNPTVATGERNDFTLGGRPETIEETAEMVRAYGGVGIAHRADHTDAAQVQALFERVEAEQGRLDILVNDIWGGDELVNWEKPFWEQPLQDALTLLERAISTHIITAHAAIPLLIKNAGGLLVEVTDGDTQNYRGHVMYDFVKLAVTRFAYGLAQDLKPHQVTAVAVTPGFLRSEAMLEHFGVTESNWQAGAEKEPHFIASETPYYVGRAIASLAADANHFQKTGGIYASWTLMDEYGFTDVDGRQPHWGNYAKENVTPSA